MSEERMALNQKERDWLQWLHQAKRKHITQREAAQRMQISQRWVRRLLQRMKREKDGVVVHGLRGRPSNRRIAAETQKKTVAILRAEYGDFGPTLAAEYLEEKHQIQVSRETLRQWMITAGIWHARRALRASARVAGAAIQRGRAARLARTRWSGAEGSDGRFLRSQLRRIGPGRCPQARPCRHGLTLSPSLPPHSQNRNFLLCTK
ncbi:MAG: hypothetical protein WA672_18855 [Candidatus Angelobacter sp.]